MGKNTFGEVWPKFAFAVLLLGVLRPVSAGFSWRQCDDGASYALEPLDVTLTPVNPKSGDKMQFDVHALAHNRIDGGQFSLRVSWGWLPVFSDKQSICSELVGGASCPVPPGPVSFRYYHKLPGDAPHGTYKVKLSAEDKKGELLNCLEIYFSVSSSGPALEQIIEKIVGRQPVT